MITPATAPPGERDRAHWLLIRHPYLHELIGRLAETRVVNDADPYWPSALTRIVNDLDEVHAAWDLNIQTHPAPHTCATPGVIRAWQAAVPAMGDPWRT